jgi:hypothetical protein
LALSGWQTEIRAAIYPIASEIRIAMTAAAIDLKVKVRPCRVATGTDLAEILAAFDVLPRLDLYGSFFHVQIKGGEAIGVAQFDVITVAGRA